MFEQLAEIEALYEELNRLISDPEVINDSQLFQKYVKEHAKLQNLVSKYREYRKVVGELKETEGLLLEEIESDFEELVQGELDDLKAEKDRLEKEITLLLIPKDPNDQKNVIMEIRAGAGGEEAGLFASDLYRMYTRYAEGVKDWLTETMSANATGVGGFKEIIFTVEGKGAYGDLKYESGVHRVQRIPETESGGRIHTSTATVVVLPEAEEIEVDIDPGDLKIDTFRSSGPGGQSVNTTDSAVRITHMPTGVVVSCQDEKSQHKNRSKAMRILRARLKDKIEEEHSAELSEKRRTQIGTGDRSERIRTYNFPQNRVTDHRIGLTLHRLEEILDGNLTRLIKELKLREKEKQLEKVNS